MFTLTKNMAASEGVPLLMRIVSASVSVSHRAARIARDILTKGDLGIVEKVKFMTVFCILRKYLTANRSHFFS